MKNQCSMGSFRMRRLNFYRRRAELLPSSYRKVVTFHESPHIEQLSKADDLVRQKKKKSLHLMTFGSNSSFDHPFHFCGIGAN